MALSILIWGYLLALQRVGGPGPRGLVPRGLVPGVAKGVSSCLDSAPKIAKPLQPHRTTTNHSAYRKGVDIAKMLPAGFLSELQAGMTDELNLLQLGKHSANT